MLSIFWGQSEKDLPIHVLWMGVEVLNRGVWTVFVSFLLWYKARALRQCMTGGSTTCLSPVVENTACLLTWSWQSCESKLAVDVELHFWASYWTCFCFYICTTITVLKTRAVQKASNQEIWIIQLHSFFPQDPFPLNNSLIFNVKFGEISYFWKEKKYVVEFW